MNTDAGVPMHPAFNLVFAVLVAVPVAFASADSAIPACRQAGADRLFCADFDHDDLQQWDMLPQGQTPALPQAPGPAGNDHNRVLRLRVPPGRGGRGLNKSFDRGYDRLYARWYVFYEPGFDFTAPFHGSGLHAGERWKKGADAHRPQGDDWFTVQVEHLIVPSTKLPALNIYAYYRGMSMDCRDPNGQCWGDHLPCMLDTGHYCRDPARRPSKPPPTLVSGRWYCIEIMADAGDPVADADHANGLLNFWVDGESIGPWDGMWFRTDAGVQLNHFWLGMYHHAAHSEAGLLFDDVVVSESRIGCLDRGER